MYGFFFQCRPNKNEEETPIFWLVFMEIFGGDEHFYVIIHLNVYRFECVCVCVSIFLFTFYLALPCIPSHLPWSHEIRLIYNESKILETETRAYTNNHMKPNPSTLIASEAYALALLLFCSVDSFLHQFILIWLFRHRSMPDCVQKNARLIFFCDVTVWVMETRDRFN